MNYLAEFKIFVKNILHWIYFFVGSSFFFFTFGLKDVAIFGKAGRFPPAQERLPQVTWDADGDGSFALVGSFLFHSPKLGAW